MIDRRHIGRSLPAHTATVEVGRLHFFAKATGEDRPEHVNDAAAKAAGYRGLPVPPTFLFSLENDGGGLQMLIDLLGLDLGRILHGEQSFDYNGDACAGDVLTFQSRIDDIYDKKGGALEFVVRSTRVTNAAGEAVADLRTVLVQRNA